MKDIVIIGGGIVGLSIAYQLIQDGYEGKRIVIIEKEKHLALHQSGRNSGVIHSGIYYKQGSLKSKLCNEGYELMISFLKENNIEYDICGKIIVANSEREIQKLKHLQENATKNNINTRVLDTKEIEELSPGITGLQGLFVERTGICDYREVVLKLSELIQKCGARIYYNIRIQKYDLRDLVLSDGNILNPEIIINTAGLNSDKVYKTLENKKCDIKIIPFKGEYYNLSPDIKFKIPIYPVPDERFPFLGIHLTPDLKGNIHLGPNASLSASRNSYYKDAFSFKDWIYVYSTLGLLTILRKYGLQVINEFRKQKSFKFYENEIKKYFPTFSRSTIKSYSFGLRAQAVNSSGLLDDFCIRKINNRIHVLNTPSPAATSSFAIAKYIIKNYI